MIEAIIPQCGYDDEVLQFMPTAVESNQISTMIANDEPFAFVGLTSTATRRSQSTGFVSSKNNF